MPGTNEKVESKKERREKKEKEKYTSPRWVSSRKIPNPNILSLYWKDKPLECSGEIP